MPIRNRLSNPQRIEILKQIRKSICESDAVIDTVWMNGSVGETVVEALEGLMLSLGMSDDELEYMLAE